jgi:hypothetical protein
MKTCPSAALPTINPTCPDPGSNPGHRGWKQTTDSLSYGTASLEGCSLFTTAAYRSSQVRPYEVCDGKSATLTGFIRVFWCLLPILAPPNPPNTSIIRGWYNRPISGRRTECTQSYPFKRIIKWKT